MRKPGWAFEPAVDYVEAFSREKPCGEEPPCKTADDIVREYDEIKPERKHKPVVLECKRILDAQLPYGFEDYYKRDMAMMLGLKLLEMGYLKVETKLEKIGQGQKEFVMRGRLEFFPVESEEDKK